MEKKNLIIKDGGDAGASVEIDISKLDAHDIKRVVDYVNFLRIRKGAAPKDVPDVRPGGIKNILVVDNDEEICAFLHSFLTAYGYNIFFAFNGQMGLDSFAIMEPDMVLLDLKMPDIDGIHVLKAIRDMGNVPVVVMTAYPSELSRIYVSGLKVEACLEKPLQLEKLLAIMKSVGARYVDERAKKI